MKLGKKNFIIILLSVGILISGTANFVFSYYIGLSFIRPLEQNVLTVGVPSGGGQLSSLDPVNSLDGYTKKVISQVLEPLWSYNYSDENIPHIHMLAVNETWISNTQLRVFLRRDVKFHDGTQFNANAVKWNLERIMYLCNFTGELDPVTQLIARTHKLFEFPDGSPIFDHFEIINLYTIDIFLAAPYSPIMDLMCSVACGMLSPSSHSKTEKIYPDANKLIGTGPYKFDLYTPDTEIRFSRWGGYWREPVQFDALVYNYLPSYEIIYYLMLSGEVDYTFWARYDYRGLLNESPWVTYKEEETPNPGYVYLLMNNNKINKTWRKAISYAINYSHILKIHEETYKDFVVRAQSPISPALYGYDPTVKAPEYNLTFAREIMVSMGFGELPWNDTQWRNAEFAEFKYSYVINYGSSEILYFSLLKDNLNLIGITLLDDGILHLNPFMPLPWEIDLNYLEFYLEGSGVDYLDPINILLDLFSKSSENNLAQVDDPWLEQKFTEALQELNETARAEIYSMIQHYFTEELFPHAFMYHPIRHTVHVADLYNFPYNPLGVFYPYPIKRNFTWSPYS